MNTPSEFLEMVTLRRFVPSAFKVGKAYMITDNDKRIFDSFPAIYLGETNLTSSLDFFGVTPDPHKPTDVGPRHIIISIEDTDRYTIVPMTSSVENVKDIDI
jgi:hypothetical protein